MIVEWNKLKVPPISNQLLPTPSGCSADGESSGSVKKIAVIRSCTRARYTKTEVMTVIHSEERYRST